MNGCVKILFLYSKLMNLYGGYSNIVVLERHLKDQGFKVIIDHFEVGDDVTFSDYQFIYLGAGTEKNQRVALKDLSRYRKELKTCAENGTVMLFTGNAFDMLGKEIHGLDGKNYQGLGICDFTVKEYGERRYVGDVVCSCIWDKKHPFVGFVNHSADITGIEQPSFTMKVGVENHIVTPYDGYRYHNLFGMHLIGAVLVNNPHFMKEVIMLIGKQFKGFQYQEISYPYEENSYRITLEKLSKEATNVTSKSTARSLSVPV